MPAFFISLACWISALFPAAAWAFNVQVEYAGLTSLQQAASDRLLGSVAEALPPRMKQHLGQQGISLRWTDDLPPEEMVRRVKRQVLLNRRWIDALIAYSDPTSSARPQYDRLIRELQATLVHELAHFYDQGRFLSASDRTLTSRCGIRQKTIGAVGLPVECRGQTQRRFTLSDDPRLLELAGWPMRASGRGEVAHRNQQYLRSPDPLELKNPGEFVAVNLEYFLIDPEYPCRRPALHDFFAQHFNWAPANSKTCVQEYTFITTGLDPKQPALGSLNPERIYQVHYLLAEPGAAWSSRWGHSMLRVVICAPGKEVGPGCLLDIDYHLVLSFQPVVGDLTVSSWDGLTGGYPVRLFILPMQRVVEGYTKIQLRSLQSYPLALDRTELITLIERAIELHWSYDGAYYFLSNNCVIETLRLLQSGTNRLEIRQGESITPSGLLTQLKASGILTDLPLTERRQAQRYGYYFASYLERYRLVFKTVREQLNVPQKKVEEWLALSGRERRSWIELTDERSAAALLLLEQAAQRQQALSVLSDLRARYTEKQDVDSDLAFVRGLRGQRQREKVFWGRPSDLLNTGYGLPQAAERKHLIEASSLGKQRLLALTAQLDMRAIAMLSDEKREAMASSKHNLQLLHERIRHLQHKAGGLTLP